MAFNISNIPLNITLYIVLAHFLMLLILFCVHERKKVKDSAYRHFVNSLCAFEVDILSLAALLHAYPYVDAKWLNLITLVIIMSHFVAMLSMINWFFGNLDERHLAYRKAIRNAAYVILAICAAMNIVFAGSSDYAAQIFSEDYFTLPNMLSFIFSFCIDFIVLRYVIQYRKEIPLAPVVFMTFFLIAPQILFLSNLRLYAAVSLYDVLLFFNVHHRYWVIYRLGLEREEADQRMRNLVIMRQIRPHFIFNCLSSIDALCEIDHEKARIALDDLAQLLRNSINDLGNEHKKPFPEILTMIKHYTRLEQMRFGKKLQIEYDIQAADFSLPSLILQPLVENAIKHGFESSDGRGIIRLSSFREGNEIVISISDNGCGMDPDRLREQNELDSDNHIGLNNVQQRVELLCGGTMSIQSQKGIGTTVIIRIPSEVKK